MTLVLTGEKASQVFGQIVNTGIDATASALTGLITGTQNWAQAFIQAGEQIIEILIKVALQAVIGAALQQTVNKGTRFDDARTAAAGAYSNPLHTSLTSVGYWHLLPVPRRSRRSWRLLKAVSCQVLQVIAIIIWRV